MATGFKPLQAKGSGNVVLMSQEHQHSRLVHGRRLGALEDE
jgi:hypothetical protein